MIVKIFEPCKTFDGVRYNTNKIEKDKGELMKVENFGALQGLDDLRPGDYVNYLEAQSARSKKIVYPQFHAMISCKGRSHIKEQLARIAEEWMKGMGYGDNPYMLIFHKDTKNNHIHLVSTRIGKDGKKISDSFEKLRAYQVLNKIMEQDVEQSVITNIEKAFSYEFSTRAQFMMILEEQGYSLNLRGKVYQISKYGKHLANVELDRVDLRRAARKMDVKRLAQLRAIVHEYRKIHNPAITPVSSPLPGGRIGKANSYTSELSEFLAKKFGVQVLFHSKDSKPAYAYTIIDHAKKAAYKGGDLMPLANFIKPVPGLPDRGVTNSQTEYEETLETGKLETDDQDKPEMEHSLEYEKGISVTLPEDLRGTPESNLYDNSSPDREPIYVEDIASSLDIADDIDDEAILGMKRRKKKKARTNTR